MERSENLQVLSAPHQGPAQAKKQHPLEHTQAKHVEPGRRIYFKLKYIAKAIFKRMEYGVI